MKQVEGGLFSRDLDREFQLLEEKYEGIKPTLKVVFQISNRRNDTAKLGQLEDEPPNIADRVRDITFDSVEQKIPIYEDQNHALEKS